jgi:xylan 1,4-beta-xylosidase
VPLNGDFAFREEFNSPKLRPYWMMLRNPQGRWWKIAGGALQLEARPVALGDDANPSLLARRQQHLNATATTELRFRPPDDDAEAGMVAFQNDEYWYFIGIGIGSDRGKPVIRVRRRAGGDQPKAGVVIGEAPLRIAAGTPVQLRISAHRASYDFEWSTDAKHWRTLVKGADGTILSTKKAGGFVGAVFGLYAHDGRTSR